MEAASKSQSESPLTADVTYFDADIEHLNHSLYSYLNTMNQSDSDSLAKEECQICFEEQLVTERKCCHLKVCSGCLNYYIKSQIVDKNLVEIDCPSCSKQINHFEIAQLMAAYDELALKKYSKNLTNKVILKETDCKACPRCSVPTKMPKQSVLEKLKNKFHGQKSRFKRTHK